VGIIRKVQMKNLSSRNAGVIPLRILKDPGPPPAWSSGMISTPTGDVWKIKTDWSRADHWGQIRSRISGYRMNYSVDPGLYAVGEPGKGSPVLVSANYKLSFDILRNSLSGLDAWVLVLDTKGINVWCAAGKGTFGTEELAHRIAVSGLEKIVDHRRIVVPQLGAPGVDASVVQKRTGFRVFYGPVRARDVRLYLDEGYRATKDMRTVRFSLVDRLVLTPMELNPAMKKFPLYALVVLLLAGFQPKGIIFSDAWATGAPLLVLGLVSVFSGAFVTPVLLPYIPFRSFALKGWIVGLVVVVLYMHWVVSAGLIGPFMTWAIFVFFPLASSYIALQFTGSTTFTCISGVRKELRIGVPVYITGSIISIVLVIIHKVGVWGV